MYIHLQHFGLYLHVRLIMVIYDIDRSIRTFMVTNSGDIRVAVYRTYRTLAYGVEVQGVSKEVVADWTMSIFLMPSRRITYTYTPEGGNAKEERSWKGLPGESWIENAFPKGTAMTIIYDPANPGHAVVPALLGVEPVRVLEDRKKQN